MRRGVLNWGHRLERWLIRSMILGAVLLVLSQAVLVDDPLKRVTSQIGFPPDVLQEQNSSIDPNAPIVTLQLKKYSSLPKAWILVNGEPIKNFQDRYVTINVKQGDVLEVDGTFYKHLIELEVLDTSQVILIPKPGQVINVKGNLLQIGTVELLEQKQASDGGSR